MSTLSQLPARVAALETEVGALRVEMREEFATQRQEIRGDPNELRTALRTEIREGDEETRRQMRILHEDVISRIALLQEGLDRRST